MSTWEAFCAGLLMGGSFVGALMVAATSGSWILTTMLATVVIAVWAAVSERL